MQYLLDDLDNSIKGVFKIVFFSIIGFFYLTGGRVEFEYESFLATPGFWVARFAHLNF